MKYHVSRTMTAIKVVGPMIVEWRSRVGEMLCGRRRRNVIIDVGRSRTANDAKNNESDRRLLLLDKTKGKEGEGEGRGRYKDEVLEGREDRDGQGQ